MGKRDRGVPHGGHKEEVWRLKMSEEMGIAERIARGLKAACIFTGLSSYAIARKTKINKNIVRAYLLGMSEELIYKKYLYDICKCLGVDRNDIIAGNGKYGIYQGNLNSETDTICWTCKKSAADRDNACSWAGCSYEGELLFKPVEGWNAIQTDLNLCTKKEKSYIVISCPLYERE